LEANTGRQKQAGSGRLAQKKAGMHAGKKKQRSRAWPADRKTRTDQKRHLGKHESRQPETEAGRQRHLCEISNIKTTRHM
jgi:hypothetical protein